MTTMVTIETELGGFTLALEEDKAPVTVANFLAYVDAGEMAKMRAYRIVTKDNQPPGVSEVIEVVQWGLGPERFGNPTFAPIAHEPTSQTGIRHDHMTISMARLEPGTASAEFFICIGPQPSLDEGGLRNPDGAGFAAFGRVVEGEDVIMAIFARGEADQMTSRPVAFTGAKRLD
jgi:peptidyl-prolyl cis-trans isomerase A (cyclophilin A)